MADDFIERLAQKMAGCPEDCRCSIDAHAPKITSMLDAIAALGCKVIEREPTAEMCEADLPGDFSASWDAAPPYPGASPAPDPRDARIAELEAALRFYAKEWFVNAEGDFSQHGLSRSWKEPTEALLEDEGIIARAALAGKVVE